MEEGLRKGRLGLWAALTFALAWGLFATATPISNRAKSSGDIARGFSLLLLPFFVQMLWFAGAAFYSSLSKRREPILGTLLGFGFEFLALIILVIFSAASHY